MNRSKFNVSKDVGERTCDGIVFDSKAEMLYYQTVVKPAYDKGEILSYEMQRTYILQPSFTHNGKKIQPIKYVADFDICYADGRHEVIDIKGMAQPDAKLKRKMFWYTFPELDYIWLCYSPKWGGWVEYDALTKCRRDAKKSKQ